MSDIKDTSRMILVRKRLILQIDFRYWGTKNLFLLLKAMDAMKARLNLIFLFLIFQYAERTIPSTLAQTRQELLEHEMSEQDLLQLTVNLVTDQSVDVDLLIEPPCAENLMNDSSDQDRQDEV